MSSNHHKKSRRIIRSFEAKALKKRPFAQKFADWLTKSFGTVAFLVLNLGFFIFWLLVNTGRISSIPVFDPYPFVLLITFVSLEAIILAIIVLISQNRENQIGTLRDELQLQVELYAEKELTMILFMLRKLLRAQGVSVGKKELEEMLKDIDTSYIERKLDSQLNPKQKTIPQKVLEKVGQTIKKG